MITKILLSNLLEMFVYINLYSQVIFFYIIGKFQLLTPVYLHYPTRKPYYFINSSTTFLSGNLEYQYNILRFFNHCISNICIFIDILFKHLNSILLTSLATCKFYSKALEKDHRVYLGCATSCYRCQTVVL